MVVTRLPRNLGPRAKRGLLKARPGQQVSAVALVASGVDRELLTAGLAAIGGTVSSFGAETGLLTVDLPAERLAALAALDGITYVESAEPLGGDSHP